uniref:Transposase n=1 Tax=Macrostomum lignano TaxID=282301 RepID=A0A1I8FL78_9PLAT
MNDYRLAWYDRSMRTFNHITAIYCAAIFHLGLPVHHDKHGGVRRSWLIGQGATWKLRCSQNADHRFWPPDTLRQQNIESDNSCITKSELLVTPVTDLRRMPGWHFHNRH